MKYLCLRYQDEPASSSMSERRQQSLMDEQAAFDEVLRKHGHFVEGRAIDGAAATTLRFESGKVSVADRPFFETKERLRGVILLDADDLNHAIQLMSQLPCMRVGGGCLEIWSIAQPPTCQTENGR